MASYETVRFITPWGSNSLSPHGLLLRVFQQFNQLTAYEEEYEDSMDGSHLPMVQPVRDLQRRVESLDAAASKYRHKSAESASLLQGDMAACDDSEARMLTDQLMRSQKMLGEYLEGLHPILREQKEAVKRLSEYLTPPTVELFHKKASHILKDAPLQKISMMKKNTCTICMDASADCVIKRTCCDLPSSSSSASSSSSSLHQVKCERDVCKCGPTMCKDCLLTHYWTSTGKGSKSYARCVCCRAEFCLKDVFPVEYVEDEAYCLYKAEQEKAAKKEEEQERRGRRTRKSNLSANNNSNSNNTTTTTTTTTTTSTHSSSNSPYQHSPVTAFINNAEEYSDEFGGTNNNNSRKKRRTTQPTNSHNNSTYNNSYNNYNNSEESDNSSSTGNNSSDNEGRSKYHLRSSQRRAEKQ